MTASAVLSLYLRGWSTTGSVVPVALVYFSGGVLSWPLARFSARLFVPDASSARRIAADIVFHGAITVAVTAAIFSMVFRAYFSQWHGEVLSAMWIFNFVFTVLGAIYQFLVLGLHMLVPGMVFALAVYILVLLRPRR